MESARERPGPTVRRTRSLASPDEYGASPVVGIGPATAAALGVEVPGLRPSTARVGPGVVMDPWAASR